MFLSFEIQNLLLITLQVFVKVHNVAYHFECTKWSAFNATSAAKSIYTRVLCDIFVLPG